MTEEPPSSSQLVRLVRVPSATHEVLKIRDRLARQSSLPASVSTRRQISASARILRRPSPPAHLAPDFVAAVVAAVADRLIREALADFARQLDCFADDLVQEEIR